MSDNTIKTDHNETISNCPWGSKIQQYSFHKKNIQILIPDSTVIHQYYLQQNDKEGKKFYWAHLWPASIALCNFIADNVDLIKDKKVAEIAAGLGLPSLLAAHYAKEVNTSDYYDEAVYLIGQSAALNGLTNIICNVLDWHYIPEFFTPDVILLSDINYDQKEFITLQKSMNDFIQKGILIILCTPQRLVAKEFIEPLLPYCIQRENYTIEMNNINTETSVFVFQKTSIKVA